MFYVENKKLAFNFLIVYKKLFKSEISSTIFYPTASILILTQSAWFLCAVSNDKVNVLNYSISASKPTKLWLGLERENQYFVVVVMRIDSSQWAFLLFVSHWSHFDFVKFYYLVQMALALWLLDERHRRLIAVRICMQSFKREVLWNFIVIFGPKSPVVDQIIRNFKFTQNNLSVLMLFFQFFFWSTVVNIIHSWNCSKTYQKVCVWRIFVLNACNCFFVTVYVVFYCQNVFSVEINQIIFSAFMQFYIFQDRKFLAYTAWCWAKCRCVRKENHENS